MKKLILLVAALLMTACDNGTSISSKPPTQEELIAHDNLYVVSLYNTEGNCILDGNQAVLRVVNGVLDGSYYGRSTISGMITSANKLEGFMERNNDTVTFDGTFGSRLEGTWSADIADCSGYFEEYSREPITEL